MKKTMQLLLALLIAFGSASCATRGQSNTLYDLGILRNTPPTLPALPPISVAEVRSPGWLDSHLMFYRLGYANEQQPHPYANSRWSMAPAQLFEQRLKARIAQTGGAVLPAAAGARNVPVLRIEADDFTQLFNAPAQSVGRVSVHAALLDGRTLIAQKNFVKEAPAPSADAAGGAKALADASDALIDDMIRWLATLPPAAK